MTLQASGPISLSQIQTEFGGTDPISLSEYYRGGALVPNTAQNSAIPFLSGPISLGNFYNAARSSSFVFTPANGPASLLGDFPNWIGSDKRTGAAGFPYGTWGTNSLPSPCVPYVIANSDVTSQSPPNNKLCEFWITGFSSDPGQSKLTSIEINGITKLGASATLYQYFSSSGTARWAWTAQNLNWGLAALATYTANVVVT